MNYPILFRLLATIIAALSAAFAISCATGEWFDSVAIAQKNRIPWAVCIGTTLLFTAVLWYLGRNAKPRIFRKEALAVIGTGWLLASLLGALPYILILPEAGVADAIFESASGLSTTGASVFNDPESFPYSLLMWRALSQWIGGLGVIVFFVAILSYLGAGAKILFANESTANSAELESGRIQSSIWQIVHLYLGLSVICMLCLRIAGMHWFDAISTMLATVSTGGFSSYSDSIAHFDSAVIDWIVTLFMLLSGINFVLLLKVVSGKPRELLRSTELRVYLGILLFASLALTIMLVLSKGEHLPDAIRLAVFQSVSIMTTTGFSTADFQQWLPFSHVLLIMLMLVGGCSGSTSGGTKVIRIAVVAKSCLQHIERAFRNHVVRPLRVNGKVLPHDEQSRVRDFILMLFIVLIVGSLLLAALEPNLSALATISATISALTNVGPGLNEIGPTHTYAEFSAPSKLLLALLMVMGRLELYAILALFFPSLWKKFS